MSKRVCFVCCTLLGSGEEEDTDRANVRIQKICNFRFCPRVKRDLDVSINGAARIACQDNLASLSRQGVASTLESFISGDHEKESYGFCWQSDAIFTPHGGWPAGSAQTCTMSYGS